jgi:hypothetical protein
MTKICYNRKLNEAQLHKVIVEEIVVHTVGNYDDSDDEYALEEKMGKDRMKRAQSDADHIIACLKKDPQLFYRYVEQ